MTADIRRALTSRKRHRRPLGRLAAGVALLLGAQAARYLVAPPSCRYGYQCDADFFMWVFAGGAAAVLFGVIAVSLLGTPPFGESDTYFRRCGPVKWRTKSVWRLSKGEPNLTLWVGGEDVTWLSGMTAGAFGGQSPLVGMDWACLDYTADRVLLCVRDVSGGVRYALPGYEPAPD
jgi:hypothetical protein